MAFSYKMALLIESGITVTSNFIYDISFCRRTDDNRMALSGTEHTSNILSGLRSKLKELKIRKESLNTNRQKCGGVTGS